jgi:dienelactone hydrolase
MTDCCTKGTLHEHTGSVEEGTFGGKPAYIARPSVPTEKAVVYVSDVFGWKLPNARVIADKFAAEGFLCVIPDVLDGDWLPLDAFNSGFTPALQEWFAKHGDAEAICGHLDAVVAELKEKHGIKKVATIG